VIELLLELLLEVLGWGFFDIAVHIVGESDRARRILLNIVIFSLLGAALGAGSLVLLPAHMVRDPKLRLASLLATPFIAGILFSFIGRRRERKGKPVTTLEAFWPAFSFALAMAVVRYYGAE
jgi:hypothetical protein